MKRYDVMEYISPVGVLTLAGDGENLVGLWLEGQKYFGAKLDLSGEGMSPILEEAKNWLDRYFAGERPSPAELPLAPVGTPFQRTVWKQLCEIPYGTLTTYGELAKRLRTSARAVGSAVGHNPISIIVPCHRVMGADGSLTGYAGGVERKRWLLEHEGAEIYPTT